MEYTGTAYSKPLQMIFRAMHRPRRQVQADFAVSRYFTQSIRFQSQIEPTFERWLYRPVNRAVLRLSRRMEGGYCLCEQYPDVDLDDEIAMATFPASSGLRRSELVGMNCVPG